MDTVELAVDGTGEARYSVDPEDAEAMLQTMNETDNNFSPDGYATKGIDDVG
jgi:hypothetical protein